MGLAWSRPSVVEVSTDSKRKAEDTSSQDTSNARETTIPGSLKRRRSSSNDPDSPSTGRSPKRRRTTRFPSLHRSWDNFINNVSYMFAKGFFSVAEMAARSGALPADLAEEKDVLLGLVKSLECFQSSNMDILRRGWRLLCIFSSDCRRSSVPRLLDENISVEKDLQAVLTAMGRHMDNIDVQLLGFRALRTVIIKADSKWEVFAKTKAIPVIVTSLRTYPDHLVLQGLATTFLTVLIRELGPRAQQQIVALGGIQLILGSMRKFVDDASLLQAACYALHQLGFTDQAREILREQEAANILYSSADRHVDDPDLLELSLSALSKVVDTDSVGFQLSPLIFRAMKKWPYNSAIQGNALVLLHIALNRQSVPIPKAIHNVVEIMKRFEDSPSLLFFSCAILRDIADRFQTPSVRALLLEQGSVECVVKAVLRHRGRFGLQPIGLLLLMNVWEHRAPAEIAATTEFGGSEHVIAAITNSVFGGHVGGN